MAFIVKGQVHAVPEEKKKTPQAFKWNKGLVPLEPIKDVSEELEFTIIEEYIVVDPELIEKEIKKEQIDLKWPEVKNIEVKYDKYEHKHDGDLHRMINKKSGYLSDMIGND